MSGILNTPIRVVLAIPELSTIATKITALHKHDGEREAEINRVQILALGTGSNGTWACYPVGSCRNLTCPSSHTHYCFCRFSKEHSLLYDFGVFGWLVHLAHE
jgi:hypothetical protein